METQQYLNQFYEMGQEDVRLLSRHGSVEFLTTVRYIERYLSPGMKILEIGAGTGRYSHYFAQKGYPVDAIELVPYNIEVFKANTQPGEPVTIRQGNALDLSFLKEEQYDITLLLGPMYHLYTEEDQLKALSEAIRVTKKGGVIFPAYCISDATMIQFCFAGGNIHTYLEKGLVDPVTFRCFSTPAEIFQLYAKSQIDQLMAHFPVTRLHYLGTDMATNFMKDTIDQMDDETFALYLRYHFSICERPDLVGATHHSLDIFRKGENK